MALKKPIVQDDGVVTNYHRILYIDLVTNSHNSIAVLSYVDDAARIAESSKTTTAADEMGEVETPYRPYQRVVTYEMDYDPKMTIETAYNYLKTLPAFEGAEDI